MMAFLWVSTAALVNAVKYARAILRLPNAEKVDKQADMYALMIGDRTQSRHEYVGYMLAADLFRDENIRDIGKGPSYVVDISVLCKEIPE